MSLIPYYLQYVSEICEGTRKAPAGIVLTEQEDLKKALQLQAEITKLGIPAFVKACAEADGTEIPQEEYDSFDPAELNTAIAQLAAASQPQEPAVPAEGETGSGDTAGEAPSISLPTQEEVEQAASSIYNAASSIWGAIQDAASQQNEAA